MASSSFTPYLGLCNWAASDRPKRADFVSDNTIVDTALGGHLADTALHMNAAEKAKALEPFAIAVYAGTGESTRTVATAFRPSFAVVFKRNEPPVTYSNGVSVVNSGVAVYGHGGTAGLSISDNGVVVRQESTASDGKRLNLNEDDCQYTLIAFK